jgi:hypothetical protein
MVHGTYLIFILIIKSILAGTQVCGGVSPLTNTDCTSLNNLAYYCCFVKRSQTQACYGVRAGNLNNLDSIIMYPVGTNTVFDCGNEPSYMIKQDQMCFSEPPADLNQCKNKGGPHCCLLQYDNVEICIDYNKFTNYTDPKIKLNCFSGFIVSSKFVSFLILIIYFLI